MKNLFFGKKLKQHQKVESSHYLFDGMRNEAIVNAADAKPVFVTGVGRSGTHFLAELFNQSLTIDSYHLDSIGNPTADSLLMYFKWFDTPVDLSGFFDSRNFLINQSLQRGNHYLESNPYLALSVDDLIRYYPNAQIVVTLRNPREVVQSHLKKGWYANYHPSFQAFGKTPFYNYQLEQPNHFFGRFFPNTEAEFEDWSKMTQVGKIAWMWREINNHVFRCLKSVPEQQKHLIVIDKFDYAQYKALHSELFDQPAIGQDIFEKIRHDRPGKSVKAGIHTWESQEEAEFTEMINGTIFYQEILKNEK